MNERDITPFDTIKVLMLKGEKGEKGDGVYDDTAIRSLISAETTARGSGDAMLEMSKADKAETTQAIDLLRQYVHDAVSEVAGIAGEVLWTNNNPLYAFAGQTVTIENLSDYDYYSIVYIVDGVYGVGETPQYKSTGLIPVDNRTTLDAFLMNDNGQGTVRVFAYGRDVTAISESSITFGNSAYNELTAQASVATENKQCIPMYIIGYKESESEPSSGGISIETKNALLTLLRKVSYIDENGQDYYEELYNALMAKKLVSISAIFNQGDNVIYDTDSLDDLKQYLTVTATYDDTTSATVTSYTLSGTLAEGTSTITVTYEEKTTTFNVTVSSNSREMIFGAFSDGIAVVKGNHTLQEPYWSSQACARDDVAARACAPSPIENQGYVFTVTDTTKYNLAAYDITDITQYPLTSSSAATYLDSYGYLAGSKTISWKTTDSVTTPYAWLALKKMDGTAFTTAELANGAEAVFNYEYDPDVISVHQSYTDDYYLGIDDPSKMVLTSGMVVSGGTARENGRVNPSATAVTGRAADTQRVLVGNFGGKTLGLSSYTLSTGATVAFACWFGTLTNDSWNGTNYVSNNSNFTASAWLSDNVTLPASSDKNVLAIAFRKGNGSVGDFTTAELAEIPTLVTIS